MKKQSIIPILNDTHCGLKDANDAFMEYQASFYRDVFFPFCSEYDVNKVIHLGDFYHHRRQINIRALYHNRKSFLEPLHELGIHMDVIPGNHDLYYKDSSSICSLKELLGYYTSNVTIHMEPTVIDYGVRVALVPWINPENEERTMSFLSSCDADIVMGHFEFDGFEMNPGFPAKGGMSVDAFSKFGAVYSGHYHTNSSSGNVHYLGSQMEFTWMDAGDKKYFHTLDPKTGSVTRVRNPNSMFFRLYYDEKPPIVSIEELAGKYVKLIVVNKGNAYDFERYVESIEKVQPVWFRVFDTTENYSDDGTVALEMEIEDTPTLMSGYVDRVETDLDRERLKSYLMTLYTEVQTD